MPATTPHRRNRLVALLLAALLVLVAACGDDGDVVADGARKKDDKATPMEEPPSTPSTEALPSAKDKPCVAAKDIPPAEGKPEVKVPEGPPPAELVKTDITVGDGAEAVEGKSVKVQYVGVACSTGAEFDASWNRGEPFEFTLPGQVIDGWNQGVPGMKVGGRRQLVIPPALGYGPEGSAPAIAPDETLVFVIDLIEVK